MHLIITHSAHNPHIPNTYYTPLFNAPAFTQGQFTPLQITYAHITHFHALFQFSQGAAIPFQPPLLRNRHCLVYTPSMHRFAPIRRRRKRFFFVQSGVESAPGFPRKKHSFDGVGKSNLASMGGGMGCIVFDKF